MTSRKIAAVVVVFVASVVGPPKAGPHVLSAQATPDEVRIYEAFRSWITQQPRDVQNADDAVVYQRYVAELKRQGKSDKEAATTVASLKSIGDRAEIERWNRILTEPKPIFNIAPNAFLVTMIQGLKPGRSLDVGMGQGRNTIYLAQQGWDSVGFDPADRAVAAAQEQAKKLGVRITTQVAKAEDFESCVMKTRPRSATSVSTRRGLSAWRR